MARSFVPAALLGMVSACATANVEHPRTVQPERPTVATHAGTVASGYVEVETGAEFDHYDHDVRGLQIPTVFKFGVAPRTQFSLQVPLNSSTGVPFGVGDVSGGLKVRLLEGAPWLSDFALLPSVKFSTGGVRGTGTTDESLLLISSRTLGPVSLDLNAGMTWRSGDGSRAPRSSSVWTVSTGTPIRGALGSAVEIYGYPGTSGAAGSAPVVALLAGPTYQFRPEFTVDAGFIAPLAGSQPWAVYVGMVTNLGRFLPR